MWVVEIMELLHVQIVHKEMVLAGVMEIVDGLMQVSFTPSETTFENFMKCNLGGRRVKNWYFWKKAQKVDFQIFLDPFWGFTLKTVLRIHDPRISWLLFGTKNHEMRGPPVIQYCVYFEI